MRTTDPEVDIIPYVELGEDEQMQLQSSGDTKVFGEQSYISGDMEVTQEKFQQHEEIRGQDVDTQEPVVLHLSVKAMDEIQKYVAGTHEDVEIETQEEVVT